MPFQAGGIKSRGEIWMNEQIRRIVVPPTAKNLTSKNFKIQGQDHGMMSIEQICQKNYACQIPMLYH